MKLQSQSQGILSVKGLQLPIPKRRSLRRTTGKKLNGDSFQINLMIQEFSLHHSSLDYKLCENDVHS